MRYQTVIFDMDGTIVKTEEIWRDVERRLIQKYVETNINEEQLDEFCKFLHGKSVRITCELIQEQFGIKINIDDFIEEKLELFDKLCSEQKIDFIPGFPEFHERLPNLKTGVGTNANDAIVDTITKQLHLHSFFGNHVYGISHVNFVPKPKPDIFHYVADQLETDYRKCIVVEDSAVGIVAAKEAGMFCIGINTAQNRSILQEADLVVDTYNEINIEQLLS